MWLPIVGFCVGAVLGIIVPQNIPAQYSQYVAVAIIAALDSVCGGINAKLKKTYDEKMFISGFICNAVVAAFITYLGNLLAVELYLAPILFFGARMLQNIAEIRRYLLKKFKINDTMKSVTNHKDDNQADLH